MQNRKIVIAKAGSNAQLQQIETAIPALDPHQLLVQTEACGVAFADVLMREGLYPDVSKHSFTPGYDIVGRVMQVGSNVMRFKAGDRVACLTQTGGYAYYAVADESLTLSCPEHLEAAQVVSLVLNYTTAYQMLTRVAKVRPGTSILVHGVAGGVGSALLELALQMDLRVYGTISRRKWQALPAHLNEHPNFYKIDYQAEPFEQTLSQVAAQGIDVVFDAIGGAHLKRSYQALNIGGIAITYGFSTAIKNGRKNWIAAIIGYLKSTLSLVRMISDNKTVAGYGIWIYANAHPEWFREDLTKLINRLEQGLLRPMVAKCYPLDAAETAMATVANSLMPGKVVLTMP